MSELQSPIIPLLEQHNAVRRNGHYIYNSGNHGDVYFDKSRLYQDPHAVNKVGRLLAKRILELTDGVEIIVGPAIGGIILSHCTAEYLEGTINLYTEKNKQGEQVYVRGQDRLPGKKVAIVEDLVTTGGSVSQTVRQTIEHGGNVVLVAAMLDRSPKERPITADVIGAPFTALDRIETVIYSPESCLLCQNGVPINQDLGHGRYHQH